MNGPVRNVLARALAQVGIVESDREEQYALDYTTADRLIRELDERGWIISPGALSNTVRDWYLRGYADGQSRADPDSGAVLRLTGAKAGGDRRIHDDPNVPQWEERRVRHEHSWIDPDKLETFCRYCGDIRKERGRVTTSDRERFVDRDR